MADLRARDLRNDLSAVLRAVANGERLRITLRGRPVAELSPVSTRPRTMTLAGFLNEVATSPADSGLGDDLRDALPETTDDVVPA